MKKKTGRTKKIERIATLLVLVAAVAFALYVLTRSPGPAPRTAPADGSAGALVMTWNLYNFGRSKDDAEIAVIARVLRDVEIVAVQEVSTGPAGAQAVARLDDELDRTGFAWDYVISDPTEGNGPERYAYLWKPSRVRLVGTPWLEQSLAAPIDREPFMARFEAGGRRMLIASFHAVPRDKDPEVEIVLLQGLHHRYPDDDLVILGDFNLSQRREAFDGLKTAGYAPALVDQPTSLRMKPRLGEHLANEYDNIFYEIGPLRAESTGVIDFTPLFPSLEEARKISDHLPVYAAFTWN